MKQTWKGFDKDQSQALTLTMIVKGEGIVFEGFCMVFIIAGGLQKMFSAQIFNNKTGENIQRNTLFNRLGINKK